jgi:VanZ family protein
VSKSDSSNKWRGRILRYAPLILWLGVIFWNSTGMASMNNTSRVIRPLLEFLFPDATDASLIIYHGYIRKFAHFAEYAGLAFWASLAFSTSSVKFLQKFWYLGAFILIAIIASLDEFNQSFNALRTGSVYDVLIDISGGLFMILVFAVIKKNWHKQKN